MDYKRSVYNVNIEELEDGRKLIYNTFTGVYGIMDKKTQAVYHDIENIDRSQITDEETINNINIMIKSGYLVNTEMNELAFLKLERATARYHKDYLSLTIVPTMDCNMCCPYCFEEKSELIMSKETQEQLLSFVKTHFNANPNIKRMFVSWYGGEPLMQKEIIYNLSGQLINLCKEKDIGYSANIITNGSLLDAKTAKRLTEECMVNRTQITIDGMRERHNKRRVLISGEDSYAIIMSNIESCKDIMPIIVRINVDRENMDEVETLMKHFLIDKRWVDNPRAYLAPVSDYAENGCIKTSTCLQGNEFAEVNNKYIKLNYMLNRENAVNEFFPKRKSVFCGGECVLDYVIDPEGYLYNCWLHVGKKSCNSGHINKPFLINSEHSKWLFVDLHEQCEKCEYLPMCQGGCANYRINGNGKPQCNNSFYNYKDTLKLAYEDYKLQKSKHKECVATE